MGCLSIKTLGHQMKPKAESIKFPTSSIIRQTQKMWNASRFCVSSLRRGHANLLCIVPILVYAHPKVDKVRNFFLSYIDIHFLGLVSILHQILLLLISCFLFMKLFQNEKYHQSN